MSAYQAKAVIIIAILLVGFVSVLAYFLRPDGDRWFALCACLVFAGVCGFLILVMPVLHCPNCGRPTIYLDSYSGWTARLTGGFRRHVKCKHCHCIIDRLSGTGVARLPPDVGRTVDRLVFLLNPARVLFTGGCLLIIVSVVLGALVVHGVLEGIGNKNRAGVFLLGCSVAFSAGLLLVVSGWWLKRRAKRFAEERRIKLK